MIDLYHVFPLLDEDKLINYTAYNLTDSNWNKGILRSGSVFFVADFDMNRLSYQPGSFAVFANGERRKILQVLQIGFFLKVVVEDEPLDRDEVGWPHPIRVEKE